MPHFHRSTCRLCGARPEDGGRISAAGYCGPCGTARHLAHNRQMKAQNGPWFDYWRARMAATFGVLDLDEAPPRP